MAVLTFTEAEEILIEQLLHKHDPEATVSACRARERVPAKRWADLMHRLRQEVETRIRAALATESLLATNPHHHMGIDERSHFSLYLSEVMGSPGTMWDPSFSTYLSDDEEAELETAVTRLPHGYTILMEDIYVSIVA